MQPITGEEFAIPNFARVLQKEGLLNQDEIQLVLLEQEKTGKFFGEVVLELDLIRSSQEEKFMELLAQEYNLQLAGTKSLYQIGIETLNLVPEQFARKYQVLPFKHAITETAIELQIVIADPHNIVNIDEFKYKLAEYHNKSINLEQLLTKKNYLARALDVAYGFTLDVNQELGNFLKEIKDEPYESTSLSHPVVSFVDKILIDAHRKKASDIHFEPEQFVVKVRYRIDGILSLAKTFHKSYWSNIQVRLKIISKLDITETRLPQDSRFSANILSTPLDFRVSTMPTEFGENIVIRLLDKTKHLFALNGLGLNDKVLSELQLMINKPQGICIVTGPTGSGKTTTLYSILNEKNNVDTNIVSLENPIEYSISGIRQTNINEAIGLTFEAGIRSILRQDIDIIMLGEIRDKTTAQMALQSAMTGHQVYSTLHTNSALEALNRLTSMGIKAELLAGNIMGLIGQRLVRLLCKICKKPKTASQAELALLNQPKDSKVLLNVPVGCPNCYFSGYSNRKVLMEIVRFNNKLNLELLQNGNLHNYHDPDFVSIIQQGIQLTISGETSLSELARVVDLTDK